MSARRASAHHSDAPRYLTSLVGPLPVHDLDARRATLARFTSVDAVLAEVLAIGYPVVPPDAALPATPFVDEPCVDAWVGYRRRAAREGVTMVLRDVLLQLQFPIAEGVRESDAYLAATRRGVRPEAGDGPVLLAPDDIRIDIAPTAVGRLPIISIRHRADFVTLVRALTRRNAPHEIPDSMGACIVSGYNNWDRVTQLRERWEASPSGAEPGATWRANFAALQSEKALYQDRFVLLSTGPYSAVRAASVGRTDADWLALSAVIRREHECAHYITRRVFGAMQAPLLDEVVADFSALVAALGSFDERLFLQCLGIETPGVLRPGGRLANYRGTPPLSEAAFAVMRDVVRAASASLVRADIARIDRSAEAAACLIIAITCLGLELLSAANGAERVLDIYHDLRQHWPV